MPHDPRITVFVLLTAVLFVGTGYSVAYNTYLDTSNPLLTHLPHPLQDTDYFANKANPLNVLFIKKAWGWTSAVFFLLWLSTPSQARTKQPLLKWATESLVWLVFTGWFFGPPVLERLILASGGECVAALPSGVVLSIPSEYCLTKSTISPVTHPALFAASLVLPDSEWHTRPRLRRGHDVSGHVFLLTMSILFLADQLRSISSRVQKPSLLYRLAVNMNMVLIGIWFLASLTTSVYFHSPFEKFTGYLLGIAGFAITQLPLFRETTATSPSTPDNSVSGAQ
ncbi:hypothetical protein SERLA73DRAFT_180098 [Serpula lacrymans var. lacrymans S7.3]|uniref:Inositol phospholipid synthesis and fat-storage-inducing TM-domain-containing protein n=2 Tax=Serpula lacrymans var. lacrymans TaxID=341189 RepID=F8PVZ3_SERL3|nr:uncharacterized protein SERLADRAFT_465550 [Serpula lacrymans var. lacrymans S7.9]EGN99852.1 hypothetical protein SERLA73DRAFT_180098 [Serpula lacrymans var. lacrymans S7.3]EGO25420.1 hypothetical protein SERLADRAFT_465550 [Serpula lacrymans var. lacrymans S7.9]